MINAGCGAAAPSCRQNPDIRIACLREWIDGLVCLPTVDRLRIEDLLILDAIGLRKRACRTQGHDAAASHTAAVNESLDLIPLEHMVEEACVVDVSVRDDHRVQCLLEIGPAHEERIEEG